MVALAKDRNTPFREGDIFDFPVAAATTIYAGALVVLNAGVAQGGVTATGHVSVGRAEEHVNNSAGAAGDVTVKIRKGVFQFGNSSAGDLIALDDAGSDCFIVDDQTVALTNGTNTRSRAGTIVDVDAQGVWVRID